jgi:gentisate 1,2-dioxygenase
MDGPSEITTDAGDAKSEFEQRARYYSPANIFTVERPAVPKHVFVEEISQAMALDTPTGWIALDVGAQMSFDYPATTPLLLGRYARVRAGETLTGQFRASGEIYYGISGSGSASKAGETIDWAAGDVFALPGGGETELAATTEDGVLFQVTNEPELAFHGLEPPSPDNAPTETAHFPDAEIRRQMALVHDQQKADPNVAGLALHFSSERREATGEIHPSIALAMNSLDGHEVQRPHRHNSVAMTLPIQCEGVYSVIEGERVDWHPYAIMITPPADLHEHHNEGDEMMRSLVVQDGGLYRYLRTMGFSFG